MTETHSGTVDVNPADAATRERLPTGRRWLAQLVGLRGIVQHKIYDIDGVVVLGRSLNADISIDDPGVSRSHARIHLDAAGGLVIEDVGSRNGVSVNGMPVNRRLLARGDRICLGPAVEFQCRVLAVLNDDLFFKHQEVLLGKVSAAAAPDLSQTLAAIQTGLRTVREHRQRPAEHEPEASETLEDVLRVVARARDLTEQVLTMSRTQTSTYELVNLDELISQALPVVDQMAGSRVTVERTGTKDTLVVGNQAGLRMAIFALCANAIEAMPFGGTLSLALSQRPEGEKLMATLSISDTGSGMSAEAIRAAFEPHVSRKSRGVSDGLGLCVVRDIAHRHGGEVTIESTVNRRTSVKLSLPARDAREIRHAPTVQTVLAQSGGAGRCLLLVDDDEVVRRMTARLLKQAGYAVVEAGAGREAIAAYGAAAPDLVLLDSKLPDMTGGEVYALLDERFPAVRVLVLNAAGSTRLEGLREQPSRLLVLPKPFTFVQLLEAIGSLLPRQVHGEEPTYAR